MFQYNKQLQNIAKPMHKKKKMFNFTNFELHKKNIIIINQCSSSLNIIQFIYFYHIMCCV